MPETIELSEYIPETEAGQRLDRVLARLFPDYSRSRLQRWLKAGQVRLDGQPAGVRHKVIGGERVQITAEPETESRVEPQDIPLRVVYDDASLLVIDKPAGLVVHPAAGNPDGTLQNALLHHDPALAGLPRAGIVHRLDKDTSGLMVVARSLSAHASLVAQLQARTVRREYQALVQGVPVSGTTIDAPIGRHLRDRLRMAVVESGKPAVTHYRVAERFAAHTLLDVKLETGRTHQIRVHLAWRRYPLVGDPLYGGRQRLPAGVPTALREALAGFRRQALHARRLALVHPESGREMCWEAPLPRDFARLLEVLRACGRAGE